MNKIYTIKIKLIILIIFLGSVSCKTLHTKESITIKDTTITNITWKDTTIIVPKQIAEIDGLKVYLDSLGKIQFPKTKVKSNNAFVEVGIKDNILTASGGCDSLELALKMKETEIQHLREIAKSKQEVVEVTKIPSIYHFFKWWTILSGSFLILYLFTPIKNLLK